MEEYTGPLIECVRRELQHAGTVPSDTLRIQNHLYGCFLLMEDIADGDVQLTADEHLDSKNEEVPSISLRDAFGDLGLYYGFVQDPRAAWKTFPADYRHLWISFLRELQWVCDMDRVDEMEERLHRVIEEVVTEDAVAYFVHAMNESPLSTQEVDTIFSSALAAPSAPSAHAIGFHAPIDPVTKKPSPPLPSSSSTRRRLARTHRHRGSASSSSSGLSGGLSGPPSVPSPPKKRFAKTHRKSRSSMSSSASAPLLSSKEPVPS